MTEDNDKQEDGQHEIPLRGEKTMNSCLRMNGMGVDGDRRNVFKMLGLKLSLKF